MKTAISIPDDVYETAEQLAKRLNKSRSEVYSEALAEYVARHGAASVRLGAAASVTARINAVCAALGGANFQDTQIDDDSGCQ